MAKMVASMTAQGSRLYAFLQNPRSDTFFANLVPLLDEFTVSITDENIQQSLPLIQPLLELLSYGDDVPHQHITHALSALLAPLSFEEIKAMELYPVIQQGLQSPLPDVQLLALEQARKMTEVDDAMLVTLIDCLGAEDASVGKKAVDVIASQFSSERFQAQFLRLAPTPRTSLQIPRFLDLVTETTKSDPGSFHKLLLILTSVLNAIRSTDVLMQMNVIKFYGDLLDASHDSSVLSFIERNIPSLMATLSPEADAFQSLLAAGTCEFLAKLGEHPEFKRLDQQCSILNALEFQALNPASPSYVPAMAAFSQIAAKDGMFGYIDAKALESYRKMIGARPITREKLNCLGVILQNSNSLQESDKRKQWFTLSLNDLVVPFLHDPTLELAPISLLSALSKHVWGVKLMSDSAAIMSWLTDRMGDYTEMTGKFRVVKRMLETAITEEGRAGRREDGPLGRWRSHVEIYVSKGEWWRDTAAEVATEGT